MSRQVHFRDRYGRSCRIVREPALDEGTPFARWERVSAPEGARIVLDACIDEHGNPAWALLSFLELSEHPYNLDPHELERAIFSRVGEALCAYVVYREITPPLEQLRLPETHRWDRAEADFLRRADDFIELTVVDEAGRARAGVLLELALADGEHRRVSTGEAGRVRVDGCASGICRVQIVGVEPPANPERS